MTDEGRDRHGWGDKGLNGEWKRRKDRRSVRFLMSISAFLLFQPFLSVLFS